MNLASLLHNISWSFMDHTFKYSFIFSG